MDGLADLEATMRIAPIAFPQAHVKQNDVSALQEKDLSVLQ